jgi:hypothetical protein
MGSAWLDKRTTYGDVNMKPITLLSSLIVAGLLTSGASAEGCGMHNALATTSSLTVASSEVLFSSGLQIAADEGQANFDQDVENVILQVARDMRHQPVVLAAMARFSSPSVDSFDVQFSSGLQIAADEGQANFDQDVENVILQVARDMKQHPVVNIAVASLM